MAPTKTELFIQANAQGFESVIKAVKELGDSMSKTMSQSTSVSSKLTSELDKLRGSIKTLSDTTTRLSESMGNVGKAARGTENPLRNMEWTISSIAKGMEYLIQVQFRWYGTRLLLDTIAGGFRDALVEVIKFSVAIDEARASFERWLVMGGQGGDIARHFSEQMTLAVRRASLESPVSVKDLSTAVEPFVGAGVRPQTVAEMIPDIAKLKTAFSEIDFKQFSLAVVGAFNIFKDQLAVGGTEAQKFRQLFDEMMAVSAVSVIRPENFTKVIQYLGEIGNISGFTTAQLFSFSGALANTSIPAANASRLLAGVMKSLSSQGAIENLNALGKQFGIVIDKTKQLGPQFMTILDLLKKLYDSGMSLEKVDFVSKLVPSDRVKILLALADQVDNLRKITDTAEKAGGGKGLDLAAQVAAAPLSKQWEIFKNTLEEVGKAATGVGTDLQQLGVFLVDIARGMLAAFDTTGLFTKQTQNLGEAGQVAKSFFEALRTTFEALGIALSPVINILKLMWEILKEYPEIMKIIVYWVEARLIVVFATWAAGAVISIKTIISWIEKAKIAVIGLDAVTSKTIWGVVGKILLAFGGMYLIDQLLEKRIANKETDYTGRNPEELMNEYKKAEAERQRIIKEEATRTGVNKEQAELNIYESRKETGAVDASGQMVVTASAALEKLEKLDARKNAILKVWGKGFSELNYGEEDKKAPKVDLPGVAGKAYTDKMIANIKRSYNAEYEEIASAEKRKLAYLDEQHERGFLNEKEWLDQRNEIIQDSVDKEYDVVVREMLAMQAAFQEQIDAIGKIPVSKMNEESKRNKIKEIRDTENSELDALSKKALVALDKGERQEVDTRLKTRKEAIAIAKDKADSLFSIESDNIKHLEVLRQADASIATSINDWMYSRNLMTATDYYSRMKVLIDENHEATKNALIDQYNARVKNIQDQKRAIESGAVSGVTGGTKSKEWIKLNEEELKAVDEVLNKLDEADKTYIKNIVERRQKMAADIKSLWGEGGFKGFSNVTGEAFRQIEDKFLNFGENLRQMWLDIAQGMAGTFNEFFGDAIEGKLKSLGDYMLSFTKSVLRAMTNVLANETAGTLMLVGKAGISAIGGLIAGAFTSSPTVTTGPSAHYALGGAFAGGRVLKYAVGGIVGSPTFFPMANGAGLMGESGPEAVMPLTRINGKLGVASVGGTPNVIVNVINQTGKDVNARQDGPSRITPEGLVTTVIITDLQNNGPIARTMSSLGR